MPVESGPVAGKVVALMAEVDLFLLVALTNAVPGKQFALFMAATIDILSAGEEVSVASNETSTGREKNRRVEIRLKSEGHELLTLNNN